MSDLVDDIQRAMLVAANQDRGDAIRQLRAARRLLEQRLRTAPDSDRPRLERLLRLTADLVDPYRDRPQRRRLERAVRR